MKLLPKIIVLIFSLFLPILKYDNKKNSILIYDCKYKLGNASYFSKKSIFNLIKKIKTFIILLNLCIIQNLYLLKPAFK